MKLKPREKLMLMILGAVGIIYLSYYFLIQPQLQHIGDLSIELVTKESEVFRLRAEIASVDKLSEEIDAVNAQITEKTTGFYPEILQKRIILLLDDVFTETGMEADSTGFSQIDAASSGEDGVPVVEKMSVTFPYKGSFEQVTDFIQALEAMDRIIIINSLQMAQAEDGTLTGGMNVDFYAIAKPEPHERDTDYSTWSYSGEYGRWNPFKDGSSLPPPSPVVDESVEIDPEDDSDGVVAE